MDFLYVDRNIPWKVPLVKIPDIENKQKQIQYKINSLYNIFEFVKNKIDKQETLNNFKFYEDGSGGFVMQYDQI